MGGVCSGGIAKNSSKSSDFEHAASSGLSGKLKSIGSFGMHKKNDDSYTYPKEIDVLENVAHGNSFDYGELPFSISRELKSSTPARTPATKVHLLMSVMI